MSDRKRATLRLVALALLAANIAVLAYAMFGSDDRAVAQRIEQLQINPERIKIIGTATRGPGGDQAQAASARVFPACLQWGPLVGPTLTRAEAAIANLELAQAPVQRAVAEAGGYWVYIPPVKNVDQTLSELRAFGVVDASVVQDPPKWRNAIALGNFRTEQAARAFLASIQQRGVTSAVAARRENFFRSFAYFVREPDTGTVARFAELQRDFPGTEMRAVSCPS